MAVRVESACAADVPDIADVAAATFPLACPPSTSIDNIAAFIEATLTAQRFREYLATPDRKVFIARDADRIVGYAIVIDSVGDDEDVSHAVTDRPATELSKLYVLPEWHGAGVASSLLDTAISTATVSAARCLWLGVNQKNERAQRFYAKHGFVIAGTKTFKVGANTEDDFVMVRPLR
jgi:ribosomal protein S18 acetylase RimI-like enzyme